MKSENRRLLALDVMRGMTIAGMLLVNNPGSWGNIYAPLEHASWNGLTPTDLVFPFFMFIMGISTYLSLRKYNFSFSGPTLWKIVRRTVVIFAIGMAVAWLALFLRGITSGKALIEATMNFDHIRVLGVMPRLAICYGVASIIGIALRHRYLPWLVALLLAAYTVILVAGRGWEFSLDNVIAVVDHAVLGPDHMYADTVDGVTLKFDPEGLLSTIPSIAHVLIGFLCGMMITSARNNDQRVIKLFIVGTILTFAGLLLSYGFPINKKIWSPTFVLTTCGLASSLLALLVWLIDIKGWKSWSRFFEVFGINPLYLYVQGTVIGLLLSFLKVSSATSSTGYMAVKSWIYSDILVEATGGDKLLASLIYALLFVTVNWAIGYILYKKKIYIKI